MARKHDVMISRTKSSKSETSTAFTSSMGRFEKGTSLRILTRLVELAVC